MAFGTPASRGTTNSTASGTTIARSPTVNINAGEAVFVHISFDNISTTTGPSTDCTITDTDGHTWTRDHEYTFSPGGVAGDGCADGLYSTTATTTISTSDTITATFGSAVTSKVMQIVIVTMGASNVVSAVGTNEASGTGASVSIGVSGLANTEHLFIALDTKEAANTTGSVTSYTAGVTNSTANTGTGSTSITSQWWYRVLTGTSDTAALTGSGSGIDKILSLIAYSEVSADDTAPDTPTGSNGAITSTTGVANGSAFNDADGHTHLNSDWELDVVAGDFSSPVRSSYANTTNKTSITWGDGSAGGAALAAHTAYKWRVRYRDNGAGSNTVSAYSAATNLTTANTAPATPTLSVDSETTTTGVFSSSAFSDADSDTHSKSQWQVDVTAGDFSSPVIDSGAVDGGQLLAYTATGLTEATGYKARVRHKDNSGVGATEWSAYSTAQAFTTDSSAVISLESPDTNLVLSVGSVLAPEVTTPGDGRSGTAGLGMGLSLGLGL
jgi:hypothetical protein